MPMMAAGLSSSVQCFSMVNTTGLRCNLLFYRAEIIVQEKAEWQSTIYFADLSRFQEFLCVQLFQCSSPCEGRDNFLLSCKQDWGRFCSRSGSTTRS